MQGEVIWDLELNEDLGPLLKLNTEVLDVRNLMRRDISLAGTDNTYGH